MKKDLIGKRVEVTYPQVFHKYGHVDGYDREIGMYDIESEGTNYWFCADSVCKVEKTQPAEENEPAAPNAHYQTNIQPINFMQANMTPEEFIGFLKGNIIKYTARCGKKDDPNKEVDKIIQYAEWLRDAYADEKIDPRK